MSRPESITDVTDRFIPFGTFDVDKIVGNAKLLKVYTALVEQVEAQRGEVNVSYGSRVELTLPRNRKQLEEQLRSDQYSWDDRQKNYRKVLAGEEVASYQKDGIQRWAKAEDLPDPYEADVDEDVNVV